MLNSRPNMTESGISHRACRVSAFSLLFILCTNEAYAHRTNAWTISLGASAPWLAINDLGFATAALRFGDFNGDGKTDVFNTSQGKWRVSFGGTGPWTVINGSGIALVDLRFGDFDGDGKTDVFSTFGGQWHVSLAKTPADPGGTSSWIAINGSDFGAPDLGFGDFDGDNKTDVFTTQNDRHINIMVKKFAESTINVENIDSILANATTALRTNDDKDDGACLVHFTRLGSIANITVGNGIVKSQFDFNNIETQMPAGVPWKTVIVVDQINWCEKIAPGTKGCSRLNGNGSIVVRTQSNEEGIVWAHEYGHARGLPDELIPTNLMFAAANSASTTVWPFQCIHF